MKRLTKSLSMTIIAMLGCLQSALAEEQKVQPMTDPGTKTESLTDKALKHEKLGVVVESRNDLFADKYPLQYNSWKATSESTDRGSSLDTDPRAVILWAGYSFSKEYNKPRGHIYSITDVREILRTGAPKNENDGPQPMACWTCKGPDVPRLIEEKGEHGYFDAKWAKYGSEIVNTIGCADCHDTKSKDFQEGKPALRVARPHVLRALESVGWKFEDLDKHGKRVAVCANCHVEYYFAKGTDVTFPWKKGVDVNSIEKYYDEIQFTDWVHGLSKAPMLKAQHPDFEIWSQGVHGKNGVTCVDCHMPKIKDKNGKVYTDHKIANPLKDQFDVTCKTCHEQSKETLEKRVHEHKVQVKEAMIRLEDQLVKAHFEAKAAWDAGATQEEMKDILQDIRHAQWRWDYAAAGHGSHMHAPDVMLQVIASGIDRAADARAKLGVVLTKHGVQTPVVIPDISTREKAQKVIGLDISKEKAAKDEFLKTVVPQWDELARKKGLLPPKEEQKAVTTPKTETK